MTSELHPAKWWTSSENGAVRCLLCPRECVIQDRKSGFCAVRKNIGGVLYSEAYGRAVALQDDPIEKKPLRCFLPGTRAFSVGSLGCNLGCVFCQNHHLSRAFYNPRIAYRMYSPQQLVDLVLRHGAECLAFTYNEPTVWAEYILDVFPLAKDAGLRTILVTNAFLNPAPARELFPLTDAANVDVKGFSEDFYRTMCHASLEPVKKACEMFKNEFGKHLELTNLVIPGRNDSLQMIDALLDWVEAKLGVDTPIHFTAYHPAYRYDESPRTPIGLLEFIQKHALSRGFSHIYLGNIC